MQTEQQQQASSDPKSAINKAVEQAKQRSEDRAKQSSAATKTTEWTEEEWSEWNEWNGEGLAEPEETKPRKSDKYANESQCQRKAN